MVNHMVNQRKKKKRKAKKKKVAKKKKRKEKNKKECILINQDTRSMRAIYVIVCHSRGGDSTRTPKITRIFEDPYAPPANCRYVTFVTPYVACATRYVLRTRYVCFANEKWAVT